MSVFLTGNLVPSYSHGLRSGDGILATSAGASMGRRGLRCTGQVAKGSPFRELSTDSGHPSPNFKLMDGTSGGYPGLGCFRY